MNSLLKPGSILFFCCGLLSSCGSLETAAPPIATLSASATAGSTNLADGRAIYVGKCTKCHSAEVIRKFPLTEWTGEIMPEMSKKAKLSPAEESSVLAYVRAVIQSPPTKG